MQVKNITLTGELGTRFAGNVTYLKRRGAELDRMLYPFEHRDRWLRRHDWDGEYLGKWIEAAVITLTTCPDDVLEAMVREAVPRLLATQQDDGYLGCELNGARLNCSFPLWMHWLAMKSLRVYGEGFGDDAALDAVRRGAEWFPATFGARPEPDNRLYTLNHGVLCFLDEVAEAYRLTGNEALLDFGCAAVANYEPFIDMQKTGKAPSMHAYSLLSYMGGAVMLAELRGDRGVIAWAEAVWDDIVGHWLFPTGSMSTGENLTDPPPADTPDADQQETCATVEWILFNRRLQAATGDVRYLNAIERTVRNALLGAQTVDGLMWTYFTPMRWHKRWMIGPTDCCFFSGPRGIARLPELVCTSDGRALQVNLFEASTVVAEHDGATIELRQETDYPGGGRVGLHLSCSWPVAFPLAIRIPEHTHAHRVVLNGGVQDEAIAPGEWLTLDRTWQDGDDIELSFEAEFWRATLSDGSAALVRGVEVLAADGRDQPIAKADFRLAEGAEASFQAAEVDDDGRRRYRGTLFDGDETRDCVLTPFAVAGNPSVGALSSNYRTAFPVVGGSG